MKFLAGCFDKRTDFEEDMSGLVCILKTKPNGMAIIQMEHIVKDNPTIMENHNLKMVDDSPLAQILALYLNC